MGDRRFIKCCGGSKQLSAISCQRSGWQSLDCRGLWPRNDREMEFLYSAGRSNQLLMINWELRIKMI